jgi:hypothetical protein
MIFPVHVWTIIGIAFAATVILFWRFLSARQKKKREEKLIADFGKPRKLEDDFPDISRYHRFIEENELENPNRYLTQKSKDDLNFNLLFELVDRTQSKVGQQYLYHLLSSPGRTESELRSFDNTVERFSNNVKSRLEAQMALGSLGRNSFYSLPILLLKPLPIKPRWFFTLPLLSLAMAAALVASFFNLVFILPLTAVFIINILIYYANNKVIESNIRSLRCIANLASVGKKLSALEMESVDTKKLATLAKKAARLSRAISSFDFDPPIYDPISLAAAWAVETFRLSFHYHLICFYLCLDKIEANRADLCELFATIGYIDATISIASFRAGLPYYSKPELTSNMTRPKLKDAYHPLVKNCVSNDMDFTSKGVLITGSNMSGKTTFLRTVTANALFAQTTFTTFTTRYRSPFLDILTSMEIADNIAEGKSYYLAEVESILAIIRASDKERNCLFVIDEVFKGTNTLERVAAAKEALAYIGTKNHVVLVATHDIELADMLEDRYELYNFCENVSNDKLDFDFKLKRGIVATGNAIKLLGISGYPESIVSGAAALSKQLENKRRHK